MKVLGSQSEQLEQDRGRRRGGKEVDSDDKALIPDPWTVPPTYFVRREVQEAETTSSDRADQLLYMDSAMALEGRDW